MKFVAPEQAPEQAEVIKNTPFWPDVDLSEFRSVMRTDGTVTQPRLKQVVLTAISEVNAELYDFRSRQQMLGWRTLAEVPAEMLDGKLTINGEVLYEVDLVNMVEIVGGVDLMEAHRNALGL